MKKCLVYIFLIGIISYSKDSKTFIWKNKIDIPLITILTFLSFYSVNEFNKLKPVNLEENQENNNFFLFNNNFIKNNYSFTYSKISDYLLLTTLAGFYINIKKTNSFWIDLMILTQTSLLSSTINLWVRSLSNNPRPFIYNSKTPLNIKQAAEASSSFYSGHASGAFAMAMTTSYIFNQRFPNSEYGLIYTISSFSIASLTASLRVFSGNHYIGDILIGAIAGTSIGFLIPYLHQIKPFQTELGFNSITLSYFF